jgi:hypothetical protein
VRSASLPVFYRVAVTHCCRVAGGMGALSWVTVSINAHTFVTDVCSGECL